ncbi:MAG: hypothetical protein JJU37_07280 [Balneolaceae bacterium]|nr:hypothetical protein [Balneolaceae bacterium]
MKKNFTLILSLCFVLALNQQVDAQDRTFGIGGMLGDPYGVSLKYYLAEDKALAAGLGFGIADEISFFYITADFLLHRLYDTGWDTGSVHVYYGPGVSLYDPGFGDMVISLRGPIGIGADFNNAPLGIFLEAAPYIDVSPDFYFSFMGAAGFRFYIK